MRRSRSTPSPEPRSAPVADRRPGEAGFSLLEAMVALAIVALVVAAGLRLFATGVAAGDRAARQLELARLAQSLLARADLDLDLAAGELTGEVDGLRWRLASEPYLPEGAAGERRRGAGEQGPSRLVLVRAVVASPAGDRFVLTTLRLVPAS